VSLPGCHIRHQMLSRHKAFIATNSLDSICGRIYISKQVSLCRGRGPEMHRGGVGGSAAGAAQHNMCAGSTVSTWVM